MKGNSLFLFRSWLVLIFLLVLCVTAKKEAKNQKVMKNEDEKVTKETCFGRDGRDGVQGLPGHPGSRGRDGRDCFSSLSLTRVLDFEKRLGELSVKCQFAELETRRLITEFVAYQYKIHQLIKDLAKKGIMDLDTLEPTSELDPQSKVANRTTNKSKTISTNTSKVLQSDIPKETSTKKISQGTKTVTTATDNIKHGKYFTITTHLGVPTARVTSERGTKSVEATPSVAATKNPGKVCQKRFVFHQDLSIPGAVNMEVFTIGKQTFLAVANFYLSNNKKPYKINSFVYRMNSSGFFEFYQSISTFACRALTPFTSGEEHYLVAANHYDGVTYSLPSTIYKWNGTRFLEHLTVPTSGASSAQFFTISGQSYLVFANYRNKTSVSTPSMVYKWKNGTLELFQKIRTQGTVDCKFFRGQNGDVFLIFASFYTPEQQYNVKSSVFKWNGAKFVNVQRIQTSAAVNIDIFEYNSEIYLAFASKRGQDSWHSHSLLLKWNGYRFNKIQDVRTTGAVKIHHFVDDNSLYLVIANYFDELFKYEAHSVVYKFQDNRFKKFQEIPTIGAYDLQPFIYEGVTYLASAFFINGGKNTTFPSLVYKLVPSCGKDNFLLP